MSENSRMHPPDAIGPSSPFRGCRRPWSQDGRTYATQGHYLVGVPGTHSEPRSAATVPSWMVEPPERGADAVVDWSRLTDLDMTEECSRCEGRGRLRCDVCDGTGRLRCSECDEERECGCRDPSDVGPCDCTDGRAERHDRVCLLAGVVVDLSYVVRLARDLGSPVRAWAVSSSPDDEWRAVFLIGPTDIRACLMYRTEVPEGVPDATEVPVP